jgi:hypothetical protein
MNERPKHFAAEMFFSAGPGEIYARTLQTNLMELE